MICEVPDLAIYPDNPAGLELYEHVNHFSLDVLERIANRTSFEMIGNSIEKCSREFGFVAVFAKRRRARKLDGKNDYARNKVLFQSGLRKLEALRASAIEGWELVSNYEARGQKLMFWAANEMLNWFLAQGCPPANVLIVDSNPLKKAFLCNRAVHLPEDVASDIHASDAIFIFTRLHAKAILAQIRADFGKGYAQEHVHVIDYSVYQGTS